MLLKEKVLLSMVAVLMVSSVLTGCLEEEQKYPNAEMNILSAEARFLGTEYWRYPTEGNEFLWIQVEMNNLNEKEDLSLRAWYFELVTEQGHVYTNARLDGAPDRIIAGANVTFYVVFEIPMEQTGDTLRFEPSWFLEEPFTEKIPGY